MRRIAFVGIENADSGVLESALHRNLGSETEVRVFDREAEPVAVAPFLVSKNKETGKLDGSESAVYIAAGTPDSLVKPIGRLSKANVEVHTGWSAFEPDADDAAIRQWLADGTWPAIAEEDDMEALIADLLLSDDDEDEGDEDGGEPSAPAEPAAPAERQSAGRSFEATAPRRALREAPAEYDVLEEALNEHDDASSQPSSFRGGRFDSMSPNDGTSPARAPFTGGRTAVLDDPLPDYLPDSGRDDEDDDLPLFAPAPAQFAPAPVEALRAAAPAEREELRPAAPEADWDEPEGLPGFDERAADDDALPAFPGFAAASEAAVTAFSGAGIEAGDEEDEDDLPPLPGLTYGAQSDLRGRPEASEVRSSLPTFGEADAAADAEEDEDGDLPMFPGATYAPAVVQPTTSGPEPEGDGFPSLPDLGAPADDETEDGLPSFVPTAPAAAPAAAPTYRGRRAAVDEDLPLFDASSPDNSEDDGEDLPVFTPLRSTRSGRRDPVETAGDDLPSAAARVAAPAAETAPAAEQDDDGAPEFAFAPKDKTPSYAAPPEKRPAWGMRLNPDEVPSETGEGREDERPRDARSYVRPGTEREIKPASAAEDRRAGRVSTSAPAESVGADLDADWAPEPEDDDFDPQATAPYMAELERRDPGLARQQSTMETLRRQYDTQAVSKVRGKTDACVFYVTGAHGGAGKTTSTWMMANTMAAAIKKDPSRPVFLIEGDYENSKLAQRLNLPPEKNTGKLAEVFRKLSTDRSLANNNKMNMAELQDKIIEQSIYVNDQGVNVIAAPYDLTRRDGRFLRLAIQKSVEYAERRGGYVFIDADTLSNDDILDRTLAKSATHVVMVSFGDQDHVDDTHRAIHTLTTPAAKQVGPDANGMGVPKDRIKLFFNKTGSERFEDLQQLMRPFLVEGHLPTVQGLNDGGWIGTLTGQDFANAVTSYAVFLNRIHPMPELQPYEQRRPQKSTPRGGFMKVFGGKRR